MGNMDRVIRIVTAVVLGALFLTGTVSLTSTLGIVLAVVGVIFFGTSLVGWCAIYRLVGVSTCPVDAAKS